MPDSIISLTPKNAKRLRLEKPPHFPSFSEWRIDKRERDFLSKKTFINVPYSRKEVIRNMKQKWKEEKKSFIRGKNPYNAKQYRSLIVNEALDLYFSEKEK